MSLLDRDRRHLWHPYTQQKTMYAPLAIQKGEGAWLIDENGKRYLDLISSWWVTLHGHANRTLAQAVYEQALTLEHVIFGGATHEPAIALAELLLQQTPHFSRVFYSDNGSTAVEVALKIAWQYWRNQGEHQRCRFLAFAESYHGDTVGAMSVGRDIHFFDAFNDLLFDVDFAPYPTTWRDDTDVVEKETQTMDWLEQYAQRHAEACVAVIIEPLVQGVAGMRMCRPEFLRALEQWAKKHHILVIYDEVMTGFYRTGHLFAHLSVQTKPDVMCLAKGLSGGMLPLAATLTTENIYNAFLDDTFQKALAHGHSYTANPLGCASGLASLKILLSDAMQKQLHELIKAQTHGLTLLEDLPIRQTRQCGTITAFEWAPMQAGYASSASQQLQQAFLAEGLLLRPLGSTIYVMPPYCTTREELLASYEKMRLIL